MRALRGNCVLLYLEQDGIVAFHAKSGPEETRRDQKSAKLSPDRTYCRALKLTALSCIASSRSATCRLAPKDREEPRRICPSAVVLSMNTESRRPAAAGILSTASRTATNSFRLMCSYLLPEP